MSAHPPRLAAVAAISLMSVSAAFGQAKIDSTAGKVEVSPAGMPAWIPAGPSYQLKEGDRVRTAEGASAKVTLADRSQVELESGTSVSFQKLKKTETSVNLDAGSVKGSAGRSSGRLNITTPSGTANSHGANYHVSVTPTQDTQVEVDDGVVDVKLKNGEHTELGSDRGYRSLLVVPGRSLGLLPHPREDAPSAKKGSAKRTDCLHEANGALRGSVEEIEACQGKARSRRRSVSSSEDASLREHERGEIKKFLQASGELPAADLDQTVDEAAADGPPPARNVGAEAHALMAELGLPDSAAASPLDSLSPEKISFLKEALAKQGGNPAIQAAFEKATDGGHHSLSQEELQALLKNLKLDQLKLDPAQKANLPPLDGQDATGSQ